MLQTATGQRSKLTASDHNAQILKSNERGKRSKTLTSTTAHDRNKSNRPHSNNTEPHKYRATQSQTMMLLVTSRNLNLTLTFKYTT